MEGTPFGRYQLIELLGRGGMGEVWRAHDTSIGRTVALKMLLPHFSQDPEFEQRFRREARAAARLDDPHVVPIYDVGEIDGRLFVTMQLIDGQELQTVLDAGALDVERAVHVIEQIASALHSAHRVGLVHRDVKPSNILLAANDFAYLIDFGIARAAGDTALTSASTTIGTWAYMAPERFNAGEIQPSSDVYALACVLYQCLTGELPFPGSTFEQVAVGHMVTPPPKPSEENAAVPTAMDEVIATGLAKKPSERYPSTVELAAAARRAVTEPSRQMPSPSTDPAHTQPWHSSSESPTAPARLGAIPPPQARKPPGRRRGVVLGALVGVVLLIAAGVVAAVTLGGDDERGAAAPSAVAPPTSAGPEPNTGPFTGVYRADFGAATALNGAQVPGTSPSTGTYAVRSVCDSGGCVATASKMKGEEAFAATMVFDEVGEQWLSVVVAPGQCKGAQTETWQVFRVQPRPDGGLTGEYTRTTGDQCAEKRTVTFTRTGDLDLDADFYTPADPAGLPPRVVSPAEALRGRYHVTRTFTMKGLPVLQADAPVVTDCLRTGDRCMSYFAISAGDLPLVFDGGKWAWTDRTEGPCPNGDLSTLKADAQFPLPQPPQNPIAQLSGRGTWVQTGSCAIDLQFDETFTRTGD
ncbi:serine/threonine-protein kinase [Mycobacterium sp. URHB0044]|uniref:serine/threonine-protein kinase n=1 Tax=Mycobacterium sp. URHB0044 TaxID=1380386 RepID=UPI0004919216|nr:serine/threonine-protein kinase [Mycobacterium sp. URHB0044]